MAGAQDEDCLDSVGVQLLEAVGRRSPGVAVAGMRADDGLGWVGVLVSSRQPGGELPLQLGRVTGVPRVGMARSPRSHPRTQISLRCCAGAGLVITEGGQIYQTKNKGEL